ncbi:MAG: hypothetical protein H6651_20775 [Ardenticatenales bacterium]|nr:hypothetical protein [Ardenticatenales bacterium]
MTNDRSLPRVLIGTAIHPAALELLGAQAEVDYRPDLSQPELHRLVGQYEAAVVAAGQAISADLLARAVHLKVLARLTANLDHIDIVAAQEHGIHVVNCPDAFSVAVAEHTLGLLLAAARRLPQLAPASSGHLGTGLANKTLGIIGYGRIGREVAIRARAFRMKILVNQKRATPELDLDEDIANVDLPELLQRADFVSLHVPHAPETHHLLGAAEFALMRPSAILLNTSRGPVVDEEALLAALETGRIAGAALDELAAASLPPLASHERVLVSPFIAGQTDDAHRVASLDVAEQIIELLEDVEADTILPLRVVPLDKVMPHENIDPKRVERLANRLRQEQILANPPIVTPVGDVYMVLDGATRTSALKALGLPHAIVQISTAATGLGLETWYHSIQDVAIPDLLAMLDALPEISLVEVAPDKAREEMFEYGALCVLHTVNNRAYLVQPAAGVNRLDALNHLTESYIAAGRVERTLEDDVMTLRTELPGLAALVIFPIYTVEQVMQVTKGGRYFPAGITRFIIPGRILRIKADMRVLSSNRPLHEKNRWLRNLLLDKLNGNEIRYYAEPVYLLDE